jgi:hypothetical protein
MKRVGVVLGVAMVMVALTGGTALAQAETETSRVREPFALVGDNPCTGEPMQLEGEFQQVTHTTLSQNGYHTVSSSHIINMTGTGLQTGDKYRITGTAHTVGASLRNGIEVSNDGATEVVISKGSSPNALVHLLFKYTVDADGQPNMVVTAETIRCTPSG